MKKVYEAPSAVITVLNVAEDILALSDVVIDTSELWSDSEN